MKFCFSGIEFSAHPSSESDSFLPFLFSLDSYRLRSQSRPPQLTAPTRSGAVRIHPRLRTTTLLLLLLRRRTWGREFDVSSLFASASASSPFSDTSTPSSLASFSFQLSRSVPRYSGNSQPKTRARGRRLRRLPFALEGREFPVSLSLPLSFSLESLRKFS